MEQHFVNDLFNPRPSPSLLRFYATSAPLMDAAYSSFASTWLGSTIVCTAFAWLLYRATQVLVKPTDELVSLLGLDLPSAPVISLAGLKADGFMLHWKPTDQKGSVTHQLTVNGINVGELSVQDASVQVSGLLPGHGYIIRVSAVNPLGFSDSSQPLHVYTKPSSSQDFLALSGHDGDSSMEEKLTGVVVEPYKPLLETLSSSQFPNPVQREHSGSLSQPKRVTSGSRRQTQTSIPAIDSQSLLVPELPESESTIRELTDKLDKARAETDQFQTQINSEEEKYQAELETLTKGVQDVQQQLQDRNNATRKLNQQVAALVTEESAARKAKSTTDRQLEKVTHEREKMKQDMAKWQTEAAEIEARISRLTQDQMKYEGKAQNKVAELKNSVATETTKNKIMEEHIRQTVAHIKDYEEEKKKMDGDHDQDANGPNQATMEEEESWRNRMSELQQRYGLLYQQHQQLRAAMSHDAQVLEAWKAFFATQAQPYQVPQIDLAPPRRNSGRRRAPSLRERRPSFGTFESSNVPGFGNPTMPGISPNLSVVSPFLNITNGMTFPPENLAMSPFENEVLLSGAPTSPSAVNTLLPSDLLGDDSESRYGDTDEPPQTTSITDSPSTANVLPGLGAPGTLDHTAQGPSSPVSIQSRSPSAFASPRESTTHLPNIHDTDRRSIISATGSARAVSGAATGTKFGNFFHLGRQRNKTSSDEGPALGGLKTSESQSLPREDVVDPPDPASGSRRRGSNSGPSWMGQMLGRANTSVSLEDSRKKRFNVFGTSNNKTDPWGDRNDSRPISTASSESHALPRPSEQTVGRFGWPVSGGEFGLQRNSHLGTDWSLGSNATGWASRLHSRTSSNQYPMALEDSIDGFDIVQGPTQAPIGTRPQSSQADSKIVTSSLRLNPAAPSFKIFGRSSGEKKSDKGAKSKEKKAPPSSGTESMKNSIDFSVEDVDPLLLSARSRDAASISTIDNASDSGLRQSLDLTISSAAQSDADTPKESFIKKLTRKSSAGFSSFANLRGASKKQATASAREDPPEVYQTEDELGRVPTASDEKDKGAATQNASANGRGFRLRSLRRKKGDRTALEPENEDEDEPLVDEKPKDRKPT